MKCIVVWFNVFSGIANSTLRDNCGLLSIQVLRPSNHSKIAQKIIKKNLK